MGKINPSGSVDNRPPPVGVAGGGPGQTATDDCVGLRLVGWAHGGLSLAQVGGEAKSAPGACGTARVPQGYRCQLHRGPVQIDRTERVLDDVCDGTKPDVLPAR